MTAPPAPADPSTPSSVLPPTLWASGYFYYLVSLASATLALQIQNAIIGYQIYQLTADPFALGLVGLAEAIPYIGLVLLGGIVADRFDRRRVSIIAFAVLLAAGVVLFFLSHHATALEPRTLKRAVFGLIVTTGISRAFIQPSRTALGAQLAPRLLAAKAVAWRTGVFQLCSVVGPAIGGLLYGFWGPDGGYAIAAALLGLGCVALARLKVPPRVVRPRETSIFTQLGDGLRYLRGDDILRAAVLLDLFAVLFGGATALLPIFANEILHVGAHGFGLLRAAPAAGALLVSVILAARPPLGRAGVTLYFAVGGFGACMIGFALSRSFALSLLLLAASGGLDMVSVLIRGTLLQLRVPDEMMGRVASINQVFVGSSNEIGAFESGLAARFLGVVPSVLAGGMVTLFVVLVSAKRSPKLRALKTLVD